ncbi:unnamed protein product [Rotaria magnacalcarata]|uniref:Uncharacterized protein n=4 Tax=Rotaria magnacalcarata TaxID=392030 RepID=A0A815QNY5_9BILA|nr:unnamed protein product [Rotaria magnacalcarata]CAF2230502.1 unnamed protein product [Rotaria magnacalcarata]CAF3908081.1 unnamed protein product [Rotaria magnacalcarata]CAF4379660.1 unnamed protein product [Rotaria magnacalcarata]
MKTSTYISILLCIVYVFIKINKSHSFYNRNQDEIDEQGVQHDSIDDKSSSVDEYGSIHKPSSAQNHPSFNVHHSESTGKYFGWASKANRSVEYFRGRRFWLFKTKDDQGVHPKSVSGEDGSSNSLSQGIWRSGIVGRRRRR